MEIYIFTLVHRWLVIPQLQVFLYILFAIYDRLPSFV